MNPFLALALLIPAVHAYEYPLLFTPNPGYRNLIVAGYSFTGAGVLGNCSYNTVGACSGRGCRPKTTFYNQTCTWDGVGNLLSIMPGAPVVPVPLYTSGTQTVFAVSGANYTGSDSALTTHGFVDTPSAHYSWTTPNPYLVINQGPYTITASLTSDGDFPLNISSVDVATARAGVATIKSNTCSGQIAPGSSCTVTLLYDSSKVCSLSGLSYDTVTIHVVSDGGQAHSWSQSYTVITPKVCED